MRIDENEDDAIDAGLIDEVGDLLEDERLRDERLRDERLRDERLRGERFEEARTGNGVGGAEPTAPVRMSEIVVAGAGTGKTHALVEKYLAALLGDDDGIQRTPDKVLAITFTDKAASEMRARVSSRLAGLSFVRDTTRSPVPAATLESLRRALPAAPISTFHALCARVLRDHAIAAGIDPAFTLLDPADEAQLLTEIAEGVVLDGLAARDAAVADLVSRFPLRGFFERKGLVECLVAIHGQLAERGVEPDAVRPVREPADVALRLADRRRALDVAVAAIRGAGGSTDTARDRVARIDDAHRALFAAAGSDDVEAAAASAFSLLRAAAGGNWGGEKLRALRSSVVDAIEALGGALCDDATAGLTDGVRRLLATLEARQAREKTARGILSFGDLLVRTRDLLRDNPSVRARVKGRYDRVLVDEYQDTSPVQEDLLGLLGEEPTRGDPVPRGVRALDVLHIAPGRVFLVGDPKQSIYGFRGADARVFQRTLDVLVNGAGANGTSATRRALTVSRRSLPPVLELVNRAADVSLADGDFGVPVTADDALLPMRPGEGPAGAWWQPTLDDSTPSMPRAEQEGIVIAARLRALVDDGTVQSGDVAVLVRRAAATGPIARALAEVGIPSRVLGGVGFFARPEVIDVIAALRTAVEPDDEVAVLTVLRSPLCAVPDDQIVALYEALPVLPPEAPRAAPHAQRRGFVWQRVVEASRDRAIDPGVADRVRLFDALVHSLRARMHAVPVARLVDMVLDEGGYALACAVEPDASLRLKNVEKLRALCEGTPGDAVIRVSRLWGFLDAPPKEGVAEEGGDDGAVRIMTVHQSKGLEFPTVIIADACGQQKSETDDILFDPDVGLAVSHRGRPIAACAPKTSGPPDALAAIQAVRRRLRERNEGELARLLYVALTRARDRIYVVGDVPRGGALTLASLLERARTKDPEALATLLPIEDVVARLPEHQAVVAHRQLAALEMLPAPLPVGPGRHRASALGAARGGQLGFAMSLGQDESEPADVVDALAGDGARARGRLAHALLAAVGAELDAEGLADLPRVRAALQSAVRAVGASEGDDVNALRDGVVERCAITLHGPVRALLDAGCALSFEEPTRYVDAHGVAVEGTADLIARSAHGVIVVELKTRAHALRAGGTRLQLSAYAEALLAQGERAVSVAAWALGDPAPAAPQPAGRALRATLTAALDVLTPT